MKGTNKKMQKDYVAMQKYNQEIRWAVSLLLNHYNVFFILSSLDMGVLQKKKFST